MVFQDRKGYEDPWRKHHTSSVTRDIWMLDIKEKKYRQLSSFNGEDREPVFFTKKLAGPPKFKNLKTTISGKDQIVNLIIQ